LTLLFDENIPQGIAVALQALNHDVTHAYDQGLKSAEDPEVFSFVASRGWVLVTRDKKIRKKPHERAAYLAAGIGVFIYMGSAERTLDEQMGLVLRTIADIEQTAARLKPPYVYGVSDRGKLERLP
jgi:uncharacterized protein with PIN domain